MTLIIIAFNIYLISTFSENIFNKKKKIINDTWYVLLTLLYKLFLKIKKYILKMITVTLKALKSF